MEKEEAIREIKRFMSILPNDMQEAIMVLVPELAESEDERIRKAIIGIIKNSNIIDINVSEKQMLAYLEKQKEQPKPSGYDKGLLEVKRMVDKLYDETSIGLNEYDSGLYNGIAETCMKLREFIKARLDSDGQKEAL